MAVNRGKSFEAKFKEDWERTVSKCIDRLYDSVSGYKSVSNISDFIAYKQPNIFYLECKSHKENTFPFSNLSQYDKLLKKVGIPGVRTGVIIWFIDHDIIIYVPIKTVKQMKENGLKSVNIRTIDKDGYKYYEIPTTKKRVFLDGDYSVLLNTEEGD